MKPNFDITGKVVAITGAAGVLCSEMARALADNGCKLALIGRTGAKVEQLADELNAQGADALAIQCDVTDKAQVQAAFDACIERFGRVDVLINGAGGNHPSAVATETQSFFDIPADALGFVFDLNFMGTLIPSQVFGKHMMERDSGQIINIGSMSGIRTLTRVGAYAAAKAAVHNLTQWLAIYFAKAGSKVRVNAIAPGFLLTEQNRGLLTQPDGSDTPRAAHIKQQTPMGRFGNPDELTGAIVFLISDASAFIDGTVLPIDGGFSAFTI